MSSLFLLVVLGLLVTVIVKSKGRARRSATAWRVAAEQLGCRYDAPRGNGYTSAFSRLEGDIDGANVVGYTAVETSPTTRMTTQGMESSGTASAIVTSAAATADNIPSHFQMRIRRRGQAFGDPWRDGVDMNVGHELFDATFVVETNAPDLLRRILQPELIDRLLALRQMQFVIRDQEARVSCAGSLTDVQTITSMLRASSALARGAGEVLSSWKALAERVGGDVEAGDCWTEHSSLPPVAVERRGIAFRIEPSEGGEVEIWGSRTGDPVRLRVDPVLAAGARMRPASPHLDDAGGIVRFRVPAETSDVEDALDLLASSAAQGAYR